MWRCVRGAGTDLLELLHLGAIMAVVWALGAGLHERSLRADELEEREEVLTRKAHQEDVERAVETPTETTAGRGTGEEWFYLADAGPSRWLKIVVVFEAPASGRIITAFPRRRKP